MKNIFKITTSISLLLLLLLQTTEAQVAKATKGTFALTNATIETVTKGTGNIEIRRVSDNSVVETIAIGAATLSGGTMLTIDPTGSLPTGIGLYIHLDAGAIIDGDSEIAVFLNNNPTTLNFQAVSGGLPSCITYSAPVGSTNIWGLC